MKILLTSIEHFLDQPTGSSRIAYDEARALSALGHETWVIAEGRTGTTEYEERNGLRLLRFYPKRSPGRPWANWSVYQAAIQDLLSKYLPSVDVVHGHVPLSSAVAFRFYKNIRRKVYTVHSPSKLEMAFQWRKQRFFQRAISQVALRKINGLERECIANAERVTALSKFTIESIRKCHGAELASKAQLVPGWVDLKRFQPAANRATVKQQLGWPLDEPVLFTLRRLVPRMGLESLLQATAELHKEGLSFHVVIGGAGPLSGVLTELSDQLGISAKVKFIGRVPDEILPSAFAACDAFVLPTEALECFGLIAIEALSSGRPVLATPVGAIPEVLQNYEPAWLARSVGTEGIAELLRQFLADKLPAHSSEYLRIKTQALYSEDVVLNRLLAFVQP